MKKRENYAYTGSPESFHYTGQGTGNLANDRSEFIATKEALKLLGFHDDQLHGIFSVLAAILHLGEVEIGRSDKDGEEMSVISEGDEHLLMCAALLGVDPAHLAHWLSHRRIAAMREVYHKPLTPVQVSLTSCIYVLNTCIIIHITGVYTCTYMYIHICTPIQVKY